MKSQFHCLLVSTRWSFLAALVGLLCTIGCRQEPTTVKGLVTLDGKPLNMQRGMRGTVVYQPTAAAGTTLSGMIDRSGHYEVSSGGNLSVAPSAYWVTVSAVEIVGAESEESESSSRRITPAKYASASDSGFRVEVKPGPNEVNLQLESPQEDVETEVPGSNHQETSITESDGPAKAE
jgi:hypothetical protein